MKPDSNELTLKPIGFVRTSKTRKFDAPHQPDLAAVEENVIELIADSRFDLAIQDLEGFGHIWLISWFHRNEGWRPRVLPPRGPAKRRGVLATRSPHRPNPIGLTCVPLLRVEPRALIVGAVDLVDGTPILDIKPYLPKVDAFPNSIAGWVDDVERQIAGSERFIVEVSGLARRQLEYLRRSWGIDFTERAFELLSIDPSPNRTRRILRMGDQFRMACGSWRLFYSVEGQLVTINSVAKGYADETLSADFAQDILDRDAMVAFAAMQFLSD